MNPTQAWRVPPYKSYVQAPLTDELLEEYELGVRLPAAYVALLRVQNGGVLQVGFPQNRNFNTTHTVIRGIGTKYPRLEKEAWWHDPQWGPPRPAEAAWLIPFDGDGHWDLCLDYRRSSTDTTVLRTDPRRRRDRHRDSRISHRIVRRRFVRRLPRPARAPRGGVVTDEAHPGLFSEWNELGNYGIALYPVKGPSGFHDDP